MRKVVLIILIMVFLGSFGGIARAVGKTQASDTVEIKVIIEDYCEVRFDRADGGEPDLEIYLRGRGQAKGMGKKRVWVAANFTHNIQTTIVDYPNDGIILEKMPGSPDRTNIAPGGRNFWVLVQAINKGQKETGIFTAGTATVTVTKAF